MNIKLTIVLILTCTLLCSGIAEILSIANGETSFLDISIEGEEEKDIEETFEHDAKVKISIDSKTNHLETDIALSAFEYGHPIHCYHLDVITPPPKV